MSKILLARKSLKFIKRIAYKPSINNFVPKYSITEYVIFMQDAFSKKKYDGYSMYILTSLTINRRD